MGNGRTGMVFYKLVHSSMCVQGGQLFDDNLKYEQFFIFFYVFLEDGWTGLLSHNSWFVGRKMVLVESDGYRWFQSQ